MKKNPYFRAFHLYEQAKDFKNTYMDIFPEDAAYVLCSKTAPEGLNPEWLEKSYADIEAQFGERLELNYAMIYESEDYIIFRKNRE